MRAILLRLALCGHRLSAPTRGLRLRQRVSPPLRDLAEYAVEGIAARPHALEQSWAFCGSEAGTDLAVRLDDNLYSRGDEREDFGTSLYD
jgi:hypothetical protein